MISILIEFVIGDLNYFYSKRIVSRFYVQSKL
jgi:hypothetical protein